MTRGQMTSLCMRTNSYTYRNLCRRHMKEGLKLIIGLERGTNTVGSTYLRLLENTLSFILDTLKLELI